MILTAECMHLADGHTVYGSASRRLGREEDMLCRKRFCDFYTRVAMVQTRGRIGRDGSCGLWLGICDRRVVM